MLDHLWLHFARHGPDITPPVITRGEGVTIFDDTGKSYLDGLSGLFMVQVGHGRAELAQAAARQAGTLAYFPLWGYATPPAIELADRIAGYAPGDLNRVFFTSGGSEAVESAWKLAKQYFKLTGKPGKHKVISRATAYHGTPQGALAITGLPNYKTPFEPVTPGGFRVPNTNFYRAPELLRSDVKAFGQWAADRIAEAIEFEGPDTVAAVFLEPVQNAGGSIPPPPGYFERVREICDHYDVLLVSDEVICAFGRIGSMFACSDFGYHARHHHLRQGFDVGILADRCDDRQRPAVRAVQRRRRRCSRTATPSAATRCRPPSRWPTSTSSSAKASTTTSNARLRRCAPPWSSSTTCRSSATSAARATSTRSSWSKTRRPEKPSPARKLATVAAHRVVAVRGRAVLPHRRPRRLRRSSSHHR